MKKILRCVRKLKWGLAVCGGGLIAANIIGLFVPLRNSAIYTETDTEMADTITLTENDFYEAIKRKGESDFDYAVKVNQAVSDGLSTYWGGDIAKYNLRVPIQENWILYLTRWHVKYEFYDWHKTIKRGVGICADHAIGAL